MDDKNHDHCVGPIGIVEPIPRLDKIKPVPSKDIFEEIELGYLPKEWEVGEKPTTIESWLGEAMRLEQLH